jgi:hypothetical protein
MTTRASLSMAGAAALLVLTGTRLEAQTTTPLVVVVLDDTNVTGSEQARLAAAGFDAVHRTLLAGRVRVGAITSGPGGLVVDATEDASVLPPIAASLRQGGYTFTRPADPAKAIQALDATVDSFLRRAAGYEGVRKVLVVIGRSAAVSAERQTRLEAQAAAARRSLVKVVWLDLEPSGCDASSPRVATTLTEPAACGVLTESATIERALDGARRFLSPEI